MGSEIYVSGNEKAVHRGPCTGSRADIYERFVCPRCHTIDYIQHVHTLIISVQVKIIRIRGLARDDRIHSLSAKSPNLHNDQHNRATDQQQVQHFNLLPTMALLKARQCQFGVL
jgi:hypothetical protein